MGKARIFCEAEVILLRDVLIKGAVIHPFEAQAINRIDVMMEFLKGRD